MTTPAADAFHIRPAARGDLPGVLALIRGLAEFEKLPGPDAGAEARFARHFDERRFELLVAERDGELAAYALYFMTYSTFLVQPSLYLEDVFVRPGDRKRGLGGAILRHLAAIAVERGCGRFEWTVLDWNVEAQRFYRSLGAKVLTDWWVCRLDGEALQVLGGGR